METMRNKDGKVISYREKIYVDGRAVSKCFKRKTDAALWKKSATAEAQRKKALGIGHIKSIDFGSYSKLWLEIRENEGLANATLVIDRNSIKNYLLPCIGEKTRLEKINPMMAQRIIQLCRKKDLTPVVINRHIVILKMMVKYAIKLNYLAHNPIAGVSLLKVMPRSLQYWLPHDVKKFLSINRDNPYIEIFLFALNTGLRRGEILGLCWDKVDLKKGLIEVSRIRDRKEFKETTKTNHIRYVPLNDTALKLLQDISLRKHHAKFVFGSPNGSLPTAHSVSQHFFIKAIEKANVPRIRFHDLRTTYASNYVMAGGDIFCLSKILGHTSVDMTAKKYAALHLNFMKNAAKMIEFSMNDDEQEEKEDSMKGVPPLPPGPTLENGGETGKPREAILENPSSP